MSGVFRTYFSLQAVIPCFIVIYDFCVDEVGIVYGYVLGWGGFGA